MIYNNLLVSGKGFCLREVEDEESPLHPETIAARTAFAPGEVSRFKQAIVAQELPGDSSSNLNKMWIIKVESAHGTHPVLNFIRTKFFCEPFSRTNLRPKHRLSRSFKPSFIRPILLAQKWFSSETSFPKILCLEIFPWTGNILMKPCFSWEVRTLIWCETVGVLLFAKVFLLQPTDGVLCLARALAPLLEGVLVRSRECLLY